MFKATMRMEKKKTGIVSAVRGINPPVRQEKPMGIPFRLMEDIEQRSRSEINLRQDRHLPYELGHVVQRQPPKLQPPKPTPESESKSEPDMSASLDDCFLTSALNKMKETHTLIMNRKNQFNKKEFNKYNRMFTNACTLSVDSNSNKKALHAAIDECLNKGKELLSDLEASKAPFDLNAIKGKSLKDASVTPDKEKKLPNGSEASKAPFDLNAIKGKSLKDALVILGKNSEGFDPHLADQTKYSINGRVKSKPGEDASEMDKIIKLGVRTQLLDAHILNIRMQDKRFRMEAGWVKCEYKDESKKVNIHFVYNLTENKCADFKFKDE